MCPIPNIYRTYEREHSSDKVELPTLSVMLEEMGTMLICIEWRSDGVFL